MSNKWLLGVIGLVVAAVAVFVGVSIGSDQVKKPAAVVTSTATTATTAPPELTEFKAEQAGFALSYPKAWTRHEATNPDVVLIATERPPAENRGGAVQARVQSIGTKITEANLAAGKQITDQLVMAAKDFEITVPATQISQGGLPGLAYVYTFSDPLSGGRGVHSHYFLFKDEMMITLVFQAVPVEDYLRLNTLFDHLAGTFRLL